LGPLVVAEEDQGDVAGHDREIDFEVGQAGHLTVDLADTFGAGLGASDVETSLGWI
jgi:hypothetical protein